MATIAGSIKVTSNLTHASASLPGAIPQLTSVVAPFVIAGNTGGAPDNVNEKYSSVLSFTGSPVVLDLTGVPDVYGNTFAFARVRSILIVNQATNDSYTLTIGYAGSTADAWTSLLSNPGTLTVNASSAVNSGTLYLCSPNTTGWTVGSSNKLLQLDPGADTFLATVEITGSLT